MKPKPPADSGGKITAIAGMGGLDTDLHRLVASVLSEHGIWSSREGSVMYDVLVYEKDASAALEILKSDSRLADKRLRCFERGKR